jgi:chemotaxis signal transduction protein
LKYFICALDKINLGISADRTERIIPVTRIQRTVCETENQEVFISLPVLLRQKDSSAPHGIVLKSNNGESSAVKTVLLTPQIDVELEIPEENIHSLPEALGGLFKFFRGAYCTDQNVILILNSEKLMGDML